MCFSVSYAELFLDCSATHSLDQMQTINEQLVDEMWLLKTESIPKEEGDMFAELPTCMKPGAWKTPLPTDSSKKSVLVSGFFS